MAMDVLEVPEIRKRIQPISVSAYHYLFEIGEIDDKNELIEGAIVKKMTEGAIHAHIIRKIRHQMEKGLPQKYFINEGHPLSLASSEPEPDLSIIEGNFQNYANSHPNWAVLVIEVSKTSIVIDRKKAFIYSQNNIPEYWLVDLNDEKTYVYTEPEESGYKNIRIHTFNESIKSQNFPNIEVKLNL